MLLHCPILMTKVKRKMCTWSEKKIENREICLTNLAVQMTVFCDDSVPSLLSMHLSLDNGWANDVAMGNYIDHRK